MGKRRNTSLTFTAVEPNQKIEAGFKAGPMDVAMNATFDRADEGTRVTIDGEASGRGPLRLLSPIFARQRQKIWDARLTNLKKVRRTPDPRQATF